MFINLKSKLAKRAMSWIFMHTLVGQSVCKLTVRAHLFRIETVNLVDCLILYSCLDRIIFGMKFLVCCHWEHVFVFTPGTCLKVHIIAGVLFFVFLVIESLILLIHEYVFDDVLIESMGIFKCLSEVVLRD